MKLLLEKRSKLIEKIEVLVEKVERETRAFSNEELNEVNAYKEQIKQIDETIRAKEKARNLMTTIKKSASSTEPVKQIKTISEEIRSLKADAELEDWNKGVERCNAYFFIRGYGIK